MSAKFLELVKQIEGLSELQGKLREEITAEMTTMGMGAHLQDPETGVVYKIAKPRGTFVYHSDIEYVRTSKPGERAGTLAKSAAEDLGYTLKKG